MGNGETHDSVLECRHVNYNYYKQSETTKLAVVMLDYTHNFENHAVERKQE